MEEWVDNVYERVKGGMDLGEYKGDDKEEGDPSEEDTKKLDDKETEGEKHWDLRNTVRRKGGGVDRLKGRNGLNV